MDQIGFGHKTSLDHELFNYFITLSDEYISVINDYCSRTRSPALPELQHMLKTIQEVNTFLPFSGLLFLRRNQRLLLINDPSSPDIIEHSNQRRRKLNELCCYTTSIELLKALQHHISTCKSLTSPVDYTPCPRIYECLALITTDPAKLRQPRRSNIELVYQNSLSQLIGATKQYPDITFHNSNSTEDLDNYKVKDTFITEILEDHLSKFRQGDMTERDSRTFFRPVEINPISQLTILSPDIPTTSPPDEEMDETQGQEEPLKPNVTFPTLYNWDKESQFTFPDMDPTTPRTEDVRFIILDLMDDELATRFSTQLRADVKQRFRITPLAFIFQFIDEAQNISNLFTMDHYFVTESIENLSKVTRVIYTLVFEKLTSVTTRNVTLTKTEFINIAPLLHAVFSEYTGTGQHKRITCLRHLSNFTLPRKPTCPDLYKTLYVYHHILTHLYESGLITTSSPMPLGYDNSSTDFKSTFVDINPHSLRLLHYIRYLGQSLPVSPPPETIYLVQLSERHAERTDNWFTHTLPFRTITVNGSPFTSLYSGFDVSCSFIGVIPRNLHRFERNDLKSLGYPERFWKIQPTRTVSRHMRHRTWFDDSYEYKNYAEYHSFAQSYSRY
jgi:hypothetical protein